MKLFTTIRISLENFKVRSLAKKSEKKMKERVKMLGEVLEDDNLKYKGKSSLETNITEKTFKELRFFETQVYLLEKDIDSIRSYLDFNKKAFFEGLSQNCLSDLEVRSLESYWEEIKKLNDLLKRSQSNLDNIIKRGKRLKSLASFLNICKDESVPDKERDEEFFGVIDSLSTQAEEMYRLDKTLNNTLEPFKVENQEIPPQ